jgi:hypothetical protein
MSMGSLSSVLSGFSFQILMDLSASHDTNRLQNTDRNAHHAGSVHSIQHTGSHCGRSLPAREVEASCVDAALRVQGTCTKAVNAIVS